VGAGVVRDWSAPAPAAGEAASVATFDDTQAGGLPVAWISAVTGEGEPKWSVERETSAPSPHHVLRQSAKLPEASFSLCWREDTAITNGFVEVKFKASDGEIDQAAGVIWRCRDAGNYYVCRANALEDNVVLYRVENGQRRSLPIVGREGGYGVSQRVAPRQWHILRVEFQGRRHQVFFNGRHLFDTQDDTFLGAGKVGLWTKADSVSLFDDFRSGGH
jgi:hypothetical protein